MEFLLILKSFFAQVIAWLHLNPGWAGFVTFLISLSESLAVIGLLIPGTVIMAAIGTLIGANVIPVWQTIAWAIAGAVVGDSLSYRLGYHFTEHLRDMWPFKRYPQLLAKGEKFFIDHGGKSVFLGRFVGPIRPIIPVIAGMLRMQPRRFLFCNITSAFLWAPIYMLPGILIGAASLELDSKTATHFLVILITILIFICLTAWFFQYLIRHALIAIDTKMSHLWYKLQQSPTSQAFCRWLTNPEKPQSHSQLTLLITSLVLLMLLVILILCKFYLPAVTDINLAVYYFFRSIQGTLFTQFFVAISFFGLQYALLPVEIIIGTYFLCRKSTRSTLLFFAGVMMSAGIIITLSKTWFISPRPNGLSGFISTNSFPSGHTTISIAFYVSLAVIAYPFLRSLGARHFTAIIIFLLCLLIGVSRLYLEAHWFTDIIAGLLLGSFCVTLGTVFYRRYPKPQLNIQRLLKLTLVSLLLSWLVTMYFCFEEMTAKYTAYWPSSKMTLNQWWEQSSPIYLYSRTGKPIKLFNVQWLSPIEEIEKVLEKNGWENVPKLTLASTINRLSSIDQTQRLPLAPKVYAGKKPILFMYKQLKNPEALLILQLWQANIHLIRIKTPLWFGLIDYKLPQKFHLWKSHEHKELKKLQPAVLEANHFLKEFTWRRVCFDESLKPKKIISSKQWQLGVLLLAPKKMTLPKMQESNCV